MAGDHALFDAIRAGDAAEVSALLKRGPDAANAIDTSGLNALTVAIYYGRAEIIDLLLARGARVDLFAAAALGDVERVGVLAGDDPGAIDTFSPDGWTALALAAHFGRREVVEMLLAAGADIDAGLRNTLGNRPLHAAVAGARADLVALLLRCGADVDARDARGWTALNLAAYAGARDLVVLLLDAGADAEIANDDGDAPLDTAVRQGHHVVADLLRRRGARASAETDCAAGG